MLTQNQEFWMTTLMLDEMRTLHGAEIGRPPRGAICGLLVGVVFGLTLTGRFVPAALVYMFTPVSCLLDYAL